jgi:phage terminase large subunit-like protein
MNPFSPREIARLKYTWALNARPEQRLPPGDWRVCLVKAGRGWGKTRFGAEGVREWSKKFQRVNIIAATFDDVRDICIEGESGILACCPRSERPRWTSSRRLLEWQNGALTLAFSADDPERLRGKQHEKLWCDELASWRNPEAWDQALFGLRLGANPQAIVTTTPRPSALIKALVKDPHTLVVNGTSYENRENLAPAFLDKIISKYEGTRLGRQELLAEILEDREGALFTQALIDAARVDKAPELVRIVIAVDPAVTHNEESDETGLVAAGMDGRRPAHFYILDDQSLTATPEKWARRAVSAFHRHGADRVVAEVNQGGDLVESTIRNVDPNISYRAVHATRGKALRAEPISALYEQGRVHHVGLFGELEDQMCDYVPGASGSPDRMDALVWALTELSAHGKGKFMDGWVGQALERIATAKAEHPGMSTQEISDRYSPLKTRPYDVADLDAQLKAQQQVPDNRFRSKSRTFGELKDLAMQNNRVTTYRTKLPDACPNCANVAIAKYDCHAYCARCQWDSRTPVTAPQVTEQPKLPAPPKRGGLLDFVFGRIGL